MFKIILLAIKATTHHFAPIPTSYNFEWNVVHMEIFFGI
jgi:hypothetical protein